MNQYVNCKSGVRLLMALVMGVVLFGIVISIAQAQTTTNYPNEDGQLRLRTTLTGKYDTVVVGTGWDGVSPSATLTLEVPIEASRVISAYMYWSAIQQSTTPDPTVLLRVDGGTPNPVTASTVYGPSTWFSNYIHVAYVADVTSLITTPGEHTYTVSDYALGGGQFSYFYGFSILVVYEDLSLTQTEIHLLDGLDSVYWGFPAPRNSPSSVNCITFAPNNIKDRVMDFTIIAGGVEDTPGVLRPNNLYYVTFVSPNTPTLTTPPSAPYVQIPEPLSSADGPEVDTYENQIMVPTGDTAACFLMESVAPTPPDNLDGASFIWQVGAFRIEKEGFTAVNLQSITAVSPSTYVLLTSLVGLLFLAVPTAVVMRQRRRQV
ncbi:MAG: DUF3344 domain-containing protein [Anaerolineae bacterium]|nr:DUF3344 domain-containing protein [Anaerolineae bacterium]